MTKQSLPAVSVVDKATIEDFKTADKVVLVGYFAADDKASNESFTAAANGLRDNFLFGATNDAALAKAEGVSQPAIVLYKSFDEGKNTFDDKFSKDAITTFANTASVPLIGEVGPETYAGYMAVSLDNSRFISRLLTSNSGRYSSCLHLRRDSRGARDSCHLSQDGCPEAQGQGQLRYY